MSKVNKSSETDVDLPEGWQRCDGSQVTKKESPFFGQNVPNLNEKGRFLRGGLPDNILEFQEDQMEDHE